MKVEVRCELVPIDFWGNLKSKNHAKKFKLFFNSTKEATSFVESNSDRIISEPDMFIYSENKE